MKSSRLSFRVKSETLLGLRLSAPNGVSVQSTEDVNTHDSFHHHISVLYSIRFVPVDASWRLIPWSQLLICLDEALCSVRICRRIVYTYMLKVTRVIFIIPINNGTTIITNNNRMNEDTKASSYCSTVNSELGYCVEFQAVAGNRSLDSHFRSALTTVDQAVRVRRCTVAYCTTLRSVW